MKNKYIYISYYKSQYQKRAFFFSLFKVSDHYSMYADGHDPLEMEGKKSEIFVTLKLIFSSFKKSLGDDVGLEVFSTPPFSESLVNCLLFFSFWLA